MPWTWPNINYIQFNIYLNYQNIGSDIWYRHIYFNPYLLTLLLYYFAENFSSNIPFNIINRIAAVSRLSGLRTNFKSSWNTQMLDNTGLLHRFSKLETVKWWKLLKDNLFTLSFLKILFAIPGLSSNLLECFQVYSIEIKSKNPQELVKLARNNLNYAN